MKYCYNHIDRKLTLARGAKLVVWQRGYVRRIEEGVLKDDVELSVGTKITVDYFNFHTNSVISHINDMQISVDYDFIAENCLLEENPKNVLVSGVCVMHSIDQTVNLSQILCVLGVGFSFIAGYMFHLWLT